MEQSTNPLIPAFTPVPRLRDRSNGWKPHIQQAFIEALAETGSVAAACRRLGRTNVGAYLLRRHPEAASFRAAWDAALDLGIRRIEDEAMDRALYGTEEVVVQNGETVVKRRRYNERLVMFLLRNRAPHRFTEGGARGLSAMDKTRLNQLKKQWRHEWEEERRREDEEDAEDARLTEMVEALHSNWFALLSPRTRAAYIEYRRLERADRAAPYAWLEAPGLDREAAAATLNAQYDEEFGQGNGGRPGIWKIIEARGHGEADLPDDDPGGAHDDAADSEGTAEEPPSPPDPPGDDDPE